MTILINKMLSNMMNLYVKKQVLNLIKSFKNKIFNRYNRKF